MSVFDVGALSSLNAQANSENIKLFYISSTRLDIALLWLFSCWSWNAIISFENTIEEKEEFFRKQRKRNGELLEEEESRIDYDDGVTMRNLYTLWLYFQSHLYVLIVRQRKKNQKSLLFLSFHFMDNDFVFFAILIFWLMKSINSDRNRRKSCTRFITQSSHLVCIIRIIELAIDVHSCAMEFKRCFRHSPAAMQKYEEEFVSVWRHFKNSICSFKIISIHLFHPNLNSLHSSSSIFSLVAPGRITFFVYMENQ